MRYDKQINSALFRNVRRAGLLLIVGLGCCSFLAAQQLVKVQNGAMLTIQPGAEMVIQGGITLDNGSTLINNGTIRVKQNGVSGAADWTDNTANTYNYGTGKVVFNGNGGHTVNSINTFERIEINASGHVTLASNITSGEWYLENGKVNTTPSFTAIALHTGAAAVEAAASNTNFTNSWVNGKLRRWIAPASVNLYTFPVGDASSAKRAVLDNLSSGQLAGVSYIDASFGPKPGNDAGLVATENGQLFIAVNNGGVWRLTPNTPASGGAYDVLLYFNGFSGLNDNAFAILKRPDASSNAADWTSVAGSILPPNNQPGRTVAAGYARRNNISSFSQFGIGMMGGALPVTLLNFDARRLTISKVNVYWQTVTEQNNLGFDIERRLDGDSTFTRIGFVPTRALDGNSTAQLDYSFTDLNGFGGISYYRLKQIDRDHHFTYTSIRAVRGMGDTKVSVLLYPNPNNGQFAIRVEGVNRSFDAMITDMGGKLVKQLRLTNNNSVTISGLGSGTYVIRIPDVFGPGESFSEKVLVIR